MLPKSEIRQVIEAQKANLVHHDEGLLREALRQLPEAPSHALIITGIRRCGKSTLLRQLLRQKYMGGMYINFEDPRFYGFEAGDLARLDEVIKEDGTDALLLDEIQAIPAWERVVRQKLDEGFRIVITGSNASLLNKELGAILTGRHISRELYPFSYHEFRQFSEMEKDAVSVKEYLETGGVPGYVTNRTDDILTQLFDDILLRDVTVRWGIRDIMALRKMAQYLVSNVGNPVTGNRLKTLFELGATSTILEYFSHLEDAYLFDMIPLFSHSLRKQLVNPRKIYTVDTGLARVNSVSFSENRGKLFENMVYLHLRRHFKEICYHQSRGECDFIVQKQGKVMKAVQASIELNRDNLDRELNGLFEAMEATGLKSGKVVTLDQADRFVRKEMTALVVPAHEFLEDER